MGKEAQDHGTDYPGPAMEFIREWPRSSDTEQRMMHVDLLIQALHGSGALAPVFVGGDSQSIRALLDRLSEMGTRSEK